MVQWLCWVFENKERKKRKKRKKILHGSEEEHGKERPWQLGAVSESAGEDGASFII